MKIPHNAIMVVCLEDNSYFWCCGDTFVQLTEWTILTDNSLIKRHRWCRWEAWRDFQMNRLWCAGRGD